MLHDVPPFGPENDPEIKQALNWLLSFADPLDWRDRLAPIEQQLFNRRGQQGKFRQTGYDHQDWPDEDPIGWYIYLALAALNRPFKYEPREGSRIMSVLKRLGSHLPQLKAIVGVDRRVKRLLAKETENPDAILFELLVALLWKINGFETVEFLDETSNRKTPDLWASKGGDEWFIECKRLDRHPLYTKKERAKWRTMWSILSDRLVRSSYAVVLDIRFHVELQTLPDDYLAAQLAGKLKLVQPPTELVSNETMDVVVRSVNYPAANHHLARYSVRCPSDQLDELIGGQRDPNRGFSAVVAGDFEDRDGAVFIDRLSFAASAFWHCDAPKAVRAKARHVRRRVAEAIDQLPDNSKGAVHIAIETVDGAMVEEARFIRNGLNVRTIHTGGKDLRWVYCHLLQFYSPLQTFWAVDETINYFGRERPDPLKTQGVLISDASTIEGGKHWHRPPP